MNPKKILLVLLLAESGMIGSAYAATYTNTIDAGTPFGLTLNSGSTAWTAPVTNLSAHDTGPVQGSSSDWGSPVYVFETIPAQVGVNGAINLYKDTTQYFYDYSYQTQSFDVSYSALYSEPSLVPQTFLITGQIENLLGSALVNGGNGYVGFDMDLTPYFSQPYEPGSGNATLVFKLGTSPESWSYSYEKTFDLSPGSISLSDYVASSYWSWMADHVDLSGIGYFEASYTIGGTPGVLVDSASVNLSVWGAAEVYSETYTNSVVKRELLHSEPIPALAPVPEPETYAMMLAGLGVIGVAARRRKRSAI